MKNIEKFIGMAKTAKDFAESDNDVIYRFPDVAKAHIIGLADLILILAVEIQNKQEEINKLKDINLDNMKNISKDEYKN